MLVFLEWEIDTIAHAVELLRVNVPCATDAHRNSLRNGVLGEVRDGTLWVNLHLAIVHLGEVLKEKTINLKTNVEGNGASKWGIVEVPEDVTSFDWDLAIEGPIGASSGGAGNLNEWMRGRWQAKFN